MRTDGIDLINAKIAIPGIGNKALQRLLLLTVGITGMPDVEALDLEFQQLKWPRVDIS